METRPLYVEEWLDSLPYIDFSKTSRLLAEATRLTNQQDLKPSVRLQLVNLYNRPYQYYVESQVRTGAHHTLQSMEAMQDQIGVLKQIAVNLGYACKRAAQERSKQKILWRQSKPPLQAMLYSLHYLAHALIFSFLEYAPMPAKGWHQLHFIYEFAEQLGQEHLSLPPPGAEKGATTTIALAYKRIVMASLADPHHLPFGAIWEIYEQLPAWTDKVYMEPFTIVEDPAGRFVANLGADERPIPYARFDTAKAQARHRLINAAALGNLIRDEIQQSGSGTQESGKHLSPYFARQVLKHVANAWDLPPERNSLRSNRKGIIGLAAGVSAAYFFLNGRQEFVPDESEEEMNGGWTDTAESVHPEYPMGKWHLVDQGGGGIALVRESKPDHGVRVGDLVVVGSSPGSEDAPARFLLGIIRWLMARRNHTYRLGIQFLPRPATPAAIRALSGSGVETRFRRALLIAVPGAAGQYSIITERGLHVQERNMEIKTPAVTRKVAAAALLETAAGFDHFRIKPA